MPIDESETGTVTKKETGQLQRKPAKAGVADRLRAAGLRPTRQRIDLASLLFGQDQDCHVTAEALHQRAEAAGMTMSLATVYNTLHQFTEAGLLRKVVVDAGRTYFDTNTRPHHHFVSLSSGDIADIPDGAVRFENLPEPPDGADIRDVHIVIYTD